MKKNYGIGTISLLLCALALSWNCNLSFLDNQSLGSLVLTGLNIPTWSGYFAGYTKVNFVFLSSLVFLIRALIIGIRFKDDCGAKAGMWIAGTVIAFVFIMTLAVFVF